MPLTFQDDVVFDLLLLADSDGYKLPIPVRLESVRVLQRGDRLRARDTRKKTVSELRLSPNVMDVDIGPCTARFKGTDPKTGEYQSWLLVVAQ